MASKEKVSGLLPEYNMDHGQRGLALIFNHEHFYWQLQLKERRGTATDKANLIKRFQELGFEVEHYDDLKADAMMDRLRKAAEADHSDVDCFVCIFLSHGEEGFVFAEDRKVDIKEVTALFRGDKCKSLVGKPKIFIFQACRGDIGDNAVTPMLGDTHEVEEDAASVYTLPAGADFLMCYCVAEDLLLEYQMNKKHRGLALIFNQELFDWKLNLGQRRGTATDKENLVKSYVNLTSKFEELGFKVKAYDDLIRENILHKVRKAAEANHSDADCFVCVFLSHGEDGHIFAKDEKVDIKEITALFREDHCKSLAGKPKIFILQACRGTVHENAVTPMVGEDSEMFNEVVEEAAALCTLPAGEDFLMCYCVSEGFVAFRNIHLGSFYIQDLCETLQQQGSTLEFTELLTLVNLKVSRRCVKDDKQMPCFSSMLTKKLYFRPKEEGTTRCTSVFSCSLPKWCLIQ
ncbi:hypothetical protein NFI96_028475 [Prochilodus magdalenae]|nr:hypothetical protein NFI96_028475 [Prochilodus magdalenae]